MPKATTAEPNDVGQAIEAAMERVIRDFVHSELVRQQPRDFGAAQARHFVQAIEAYLAAGGSGVPLCGRIQAGLE